MAKTIFVSNRLPVTVGKSAGGLQYKESIGGLATGLKSIHEEEGNSVWVGWSGMEKEDLSGNDENDIAKYLREEYSCIPLHLSHFDLEMYYYGFSNKTIWPLFHYFPNYTEYSDRMWKHYKEVNRLYFNKVRSIMHGEESVWVHDYQLMLLPKMLKDEFPNAQIGFFLHIPFPSYEIFRLLPWREEMLEGVLGSDLIGFHTYDYTRHFLSSVRRILGYEHNLGHITVGRRTVSTDVFPMGIDFKKYAEAHKLKETKKELDRLKDKIDKGTRIILSVDRLDYSKGLPERLKAFDRLLQKNPEYKEKVTLILIVAPSRTQVQTYADLKNEVEILVSMINGKHGSIGWVPVWFFFQPFNFYELSALYSKASALLVTPLRDGMNLVAKEYVAGNKDMKGAVVLSETAGAARELSEAIVVNPNNIDQIADGLNSALRLTDEEKTAKNKLMRRRLERYNVEHWAKDFMEKLKEVRVYQDEGTSEYLNIQNQNNMIAAMRKSKKRLFLLDYDGTLMYFYDRPEDAKPDKQLLSFLEEMIANDKNELVVISGRDNKTLEKWLGHLDVNLVASHGLWMRERGKSEWELGEALSSDWKSTIEPVLQVYTDRTPGSLIEEKEYSLAWHYRRCEPDLAAIRVSELREALMSLTSNLNIGILDGNKVIEVKDTSVNKGRAASNWIVNEEYDFIFCAGDDVTDEDMFSIVPKGGYSVKIGSGITQASYNLRSVDEMRGLLKKISDI